MRGSRSSFIYNEILPRTSDWKKAIDKVLYRDGIYKSSSNATILLRKRKFSEHNGGTKYMDGNSPSPFIGDASNRRSCCVVFSDVQRGSMGGMVTTARIYTEKESIRTNCEKNAQAGITDTFTHHDLAAKMLSSKNAKTSSDIPSSESDSEYQNIIECFLFPIILQ